jgi:hypothetical protein
MNNFQQKLSKLPKEAQNYLVAMEAVKLNTFICEKYSLKKEQVGKYVDLVSSLFFREVGLNDLIKTVIATFAFDEVRAKEMSRDISGIRLLVIKDWLGDDVGAYIKSLGGKIEDYNSYIEEQKKAVIDEEKFFKAQMQEEVEVEEPKPVPAPVSLEDGGAYVFDINKEKDDSVNNLKGQVLDLLDPENEDLAEEYNNVLLQLLIDGGATVKGELERALYDNQERITSAPFVLEGKPSSGTVANWIKYFLATKGSAIFDNIGLSAFMVQSPNTKVLNDVEKNRLHKLLVLYRNLKFFPDSMPKNTNGEGWEIIPTQVGEEAERQAKIVTEKQVTENELKTIELRKVLAKYPEGSLARRAVEEEIKKYKQKT